MEDRPFQLKEYFPHIRIKRNVSNDGYEQDEAVSGAQYTQVYDATTAAAWYLASQIDVAGWTKEGLTAFFAAQFTQRPQPYAVVGAVDTSPAALGGMLIEDMVLVSDVPLNLDNALWVLAGFPRADSDWMTIKYAEGTQRVQTTTCPMAVTMNDSWSYGSAQPTASGTLYCYRAVTCRKLAPTPQDVVDYPPVRWVAEGIATEEPEFVHIARLRRSYELQQLT